MKLGKKGFVRVLIYVVVIFVVMALVVVLYRQSESQEPITRVICWDNSTAESLDECPARPSGFCDSDSDCALNANGACCDGGGSCRALISVEPCDGCIPKIECLCVDGICDFDYDCSVCVACTEEAKICPDGVTTVARVLPDCRFEKCPEAG